MDWLSEVITNPVPLLVVAVVALVILGNVVQAVRAKGQMANVEGDGYVSPSDSRAIETMSPMYNSGSGAYISPGSLIDVDGHAVMH
ncbi:hypothetical protein DIE14_01380 [Burkholderia sp. Bp9017]|uniref:hypothetical protein n=1 Tax=unclassified Burkholderia TaxID=2613784 RepID=UPI000F5DD885|nr:MULTISPECIES: hypothetical protein [unclassified Burkholderia]RQZ31596.1 hypothetical protein DIE14_01380 [Burkholderia sp. Bp9017]RQZ37728.1 hypothetical protein DIE13_01370 [Burkholderia sp. Bp9016]